jgi:hypothetical protein
MATASAHSAHIRDPRPRTLRNSTIRPRCRLSTVDLSLITIVECHALAVNQVVATVGHRQPCLEVSRTAAGDSATSSDSGERGQNGQT